MVNWTVGSGGTYSTWNAALSALPATLTDDYTLTQISNITESAGTTRSLDLASHQLILESTSTHWGDPTAGHITTLSPTAGAALISLTVGVTGDLEVKNLNLYYGHTGGSGKALELISSGANLLIHDIIMVNTNNSGTGLYIRKIAGAGFNRVWNCMSLDFAVCGFTLIESGGGSHLQIENCTALNNGCGFEFLASAITAKNLVATDSAVSDFQTLISATGNGCASSDASAGDGNWAAGSGNLTGIVPANEFVSISATNSNCGKLKLTGVLAFGGVTPVIPLNTHGIRGNAIDVSIGADEILATLPASWTIGTAGDFVSWDAALAYLPPTLAADYTITQTSNVVETTQALRVKNLGGFKLTLTSASPHRGDPTAGYKITKIDPLSGRIIHLDLGVPGGAIEIKHLNFQNGYSGAASTHSLQVRSVVAAEIHDIIFVDTGNTYGGLFVDVSASSVVSMHVWNCLSVGHTEGLKFSNASTTPDFLVENCTAIAEAASTAAISLSGFGTTTVVRNCVAVGTGSGSDFVFAGASKDGYGNASEDASAQDINWGAGSNNLTSIVPANEFESLLASSSVCGKLEGASVLRNVGIAVVIASNVVGIRGTVRPHQTILYSIGADEAKIVLDLGNISIAATNLAAESTAEGPQILVTWDAPTHQDTTQVKLIRKLLAYPESITDGEELVAAPAGNAPLSYVDVNPLIERAWCYALFSYHAATQVWTADSVFGEGQTAIPSSPTGYFYEVEVGGFSGSTEPAEWPTNIGDTVIDGDITWICRSTNPGWVTGKRARNAGFTWDSTYIKQLLFSNLLPDMYKNYDGYSDILALSPQQDFSLEGIWRAFREDGKTEKGQLQRFLEIFGIMLSRIKGAADFYPKLVDPDETLPQYLPLLAGLLGWELNTTVPTQTQRQELLSAVPVYKKKGTSDILDLLITRVAGVANTIIDPMSQHILKSNYASRRSARGGQETTYSVWADSTVYSLGDIVIPVAGNETGYYYQVREAGTSDSVEPTWPVIPGDDVAEAGASTVIWRTRQFGVPHLTADVIGVVASISIDDTTEFEVGTTVNIRDANTPAGEEIVIDTIPDSVTLTFTTNLANAYAMADSAVVTPAFNWHDDKTGFIWDRPTVEEFDDETEARLRVPPLVLEEPELYSFDILRIWFLLASGEEMSTDEQERIERLIDGFAPADMRHVIRIESL